MILYKRDIEKLKQIQEHINSNLDQDLSVVELCKKFALSSAKLQRHFSFYFQQPLHHYVFEQRMLKAKKLLDNKANSVADIAFIVGYRDRCSFTRAFRKFFSDKPINFLKSS